MLRGIMVMGAFLVVAAVRALAADIAPPIGGISYSPSGVIAFADFAKGIDEAHIRADLKQLKPLTHEIRIYAMGSGMDRVPVLAAAMDMKVTVGVWLGADQASNDAEITRAVAAVQKTPSAVTRVIVGNEAIQHGEVNDDQVIAAMDAVRRAIASTHIPVGTAEIWSIMRDHPRVVAASDFIGVHIIPYWDGVSAAEAPAYIASRYDELAKAYPGKPIVIAETGWPSSGPKRQGAVPSPIAQAQFTKAFIALARTRGWSYFLVEAYDQPWKAARDGDTPLWGLFKSNGTPKPAVRPLARAAALRRGL